MKVRVRVHASRKGMQRLALIAGLSLPLLAGATLVQPSAPKAFDFDEYAAEKAASVQSNHRGTRLEAAERRSAVGNVTDLDERINGTLAIYGVQQGTGTRQ